MAGAVLYKHLLICNNMRKIHSYSALVFILFLITMSAPVFINQASAIVFQSQAFGIQVGDALIPTEAGTDNLIYGVMGASTLGSFILFQNGSGNTKFQVGVDGDVTATGNIAAAQLCIQGDCKSAWPSATESDTLQTVTDRGNATTQPITVSTIDTGHGANEIYAMNQDVTTSSNVTFGAITATGGTSANWNTAYSQRLQWDGGATGLTASTGRTSLGLGNLAVLDSVGSSQITNGSILFADINHNGCVDGHIVEWNGSAWSCGTDDVGGGSGTFYYIPKWTDATTLGDSLIYDSGTYVGIGTIAVGFKLQVQDTADNDAIIRVDGANATSEYVSLGIQTGYAVITAGYEGAGNTALVFKTSAASEAERMRIDKDGNVGIGKSNPSYLLDVAGTAQFSTLLLNNVDAKSTCDAATKGNLVFDTVNDRPYVCASAGWMPLDSDYDKDGIVTAKDNAAGPGDAVSNANCAADNGGYCWLGSESKSGLDGELAPSNILIGTNLFGIDGSMNVARPGCTPGDAPAQSGDAQYDNCDNDHDGSIDELDGSIRN